MLKLFIIIENGGIMELQLLKSSDSRLKEICEEVIDFENKQFYTDVIEKIKNLCIGQYAFAAAAPQFGINKRFIVFVSAEEKKVSSVQELQQLESHYDVMAYFNPKITMMKGLTYYYEACMSTGDIIGKVARPYYIEFDYQDIDGNYHHECLENFKARVFCHEADHLDGIEFLDKASDITYNADLKKRIEIRDRYPNKIISKDCEFNQEEIDLRFRTKVYEKNKK